MKERNLITNFFKQFKKTKTGRPTKQSQKPMFVKELMREQKNVVDSNDQLKIEKLSEIEIDLKINYLTPKHKFLLQKILLNNKGLLIKKGMCNVCLDDQGNQVSVRLNKTLYPEMKGEDCIKWRAKGEKIGEGSESKIFDSDETYKLTDQALQIKPKTSVRWPKVLKVMFKEEICSNKMKALQFHKKKVYPSSNLSFFVDKVEGISLDHYKLSDLTVAEYLNFLLKVIEEIKNTHRNGPHLDLHLGNIIYNKVKIAFIDFAGFEPVLIDMLWDVRALAVFLLVEATTEYVGQGFRFPKTERVLEIVNKDNVTKLPGSQEEREKLFEILKEMLLFKEANSVEQHIQNLDEFREKIEKMLARMSNSLSL